MVIDDHPGAYTLQMTALSCDTCNNPEPMGDVASICEIPVHVLKQAIYLWTISFWTGPTPGKHNRHFQSRRTLIWIETDDDALVFDQLVESNAISIFVGWVVTFHCFDCLFNCFTSSSVFPHAWVTIQKWVAYFVNISNRLTRRTLQEFTKHGFGTVSNEHLQPSRVLMMHPTGTLCWKQNCIWV